MTRSMLDTKTVRCLLKKYLAVTRRMVAAPITSLCISAITQSELRVGLAGARTPPRFMRRPENSCDGSTCFRRKRSRPSLRTGSDLHRTKG